MRTNEGAWVPVTVGKLKTAGYKPTIFDPRLLGIGCTSLGILHNGTIEGIRENTVKNVVRSSILTEPDGLVRLDIYYPEGQERHVRMTGPPAYRLASYEVVYNFGPDKPTRRFEAKFEVESVEAPPPVYWFPKHQKYREQADTRVVYDEVCDVTLNSVNQTISASTFDIPNFDLPAGVRITGLPNSGSKVWDGTKLVDESLYSPPAPAPESVAAERTRNSRWWSWVAYALLGIGVVGFGRFLLLRWRGRRAAP